jgi:hypothetical protein
VENDEKIFRTVKKVDRSSGKNTERNFKRIARSVETPCRSIFLVNREAEAAVD